MGGFYLAIAASWLNALLFCSRVLSAHFSLQSYCAFIMLLQITSDVLVIFGNAKELRWVTALLSIGLVLGWCLPAVVPGFVAGLPMSMPAWPQESH